MGLFKQEFHKLLTRSGLVFFCRISGAAIAFITQIMMARWMGADELGIYIYAFSLAMLLSTVASLGLPAASLRFISQYLAKGKTAFINGFLEKGRKIVFLSSLCLTTIIFTVISTLSISISVSPVKAIDQIISFTVLIDLSKSIDKDYIPVLIGIICIPFIAIFRFHDRVAHAFSWFTLSFLPSMTLRPLFFLVALYVMWDLTGKLSAEIAMTIQFCVIVMMTTFQYFLLRLKLKRRVNNSNVEYEQSLWLRVSMPLLIITVFTQYFPELSIIIIGTDLPPDKIAIYNASYRIALLIGFVYNAVSAAIVPKASQLYEQGDIVGLQRYISRATQLNFFISMFGVVIFVFAGKPLLALFGEQFVTGYTALLVLASAQLFLVSVGPVAILLNITGHQNNCLYVFSASILLTVLLEYYLVPKFGILGAAIMVFIVVVFWSLWLHLLVKRHLKIHSSIFSFLAITQCSSSTGSVIKKTK